MLSKIGAGLRHLEPVRQLVFNRSELYVRARFRERRSQFYSKYWQDVCRAGGWECEALGHDCYRIRSGDRVAYCIGYYVQLDTPSVLRIAGEKALSRTLLQQIGVPVPDQQSFDLSGIPGARKFLEKAGRVVVKPSEGGGGAGVTTDVSDPASLRKAAMKAASVNSSLIVEKQVSGANYRLLYLDGTLIDAVRRDTPTVIGDGASSIARLIDIENECRLNGGAFTALSPLTRDASSKHFLRANGISATAIPAFGQVLGVKRAINQNCARDNHRITDHVHPYFHALGRRIVDHIDIKLLGIDVIAPSIDAPLEDTGGAVNEINGTPAFHHHELIHRHRGLSHVGPQVLEYILSPRKIARLAG